ncbi:hypothetical protein [Chryseobacterium sp. ERMR1:04]|uniref:hypothetical protein n=1 Tax=Chryseobacterium sp. ERMR1:04 TaxID=1705393 RepID=UPI0006C88627|nr:hypothetical protein [Chryseobacterium sp. ERMR1:04]KPH13168.1 hypothetical protein AMQ68_11845 [Chryseobacterium sp. ERMR1:04]
MKTKLLLFFIFIFITCSSQSIADVHKIDTDLIITKIIESNRAKVLKNDTDKIVRQLKETEMSLTDATPKQFERLFVSLGADGMPNFKLKKIITKDDYEYFLLQSQNTDPTEISDALKKKYNFDLLENILRDREKEKRYEYYQFTKPYFSKDHQKAYIEVEYYSAGIYGDGMAYILEKINGEWVIVRGLNLWIT